MTRAVLPQRRPCSTFEVSFWGITFTVTVGIYPNGQVGEVFINGGKSGAHLEAVARDSAILLSLLLQHGADIATVKRALTRDRDGAAATIIGEIVDRLSTGHPPAPRGAA